MDDAAITDANTKIATNISSPSSSADVINPSSAETPKANVPSSSADDLHGPAFAPKPSEVNSTLPTSTTGTSIEAVTSTAPTATQSPSATSLTEHIRPIMLSRSGTSEALKTVSSNNIRSASPSSNYSRSNSTDSVRHPDLSSEVAALSAKLVQAANVQSNLDDTLQTARHDLDITRKRVTQLEEAARSHVDMIDRGLLVRKQDVEEMETRLAAEAADERKQRAQMEKDKKAIELELENLTSALFEEANTMVIAARRDREATEKKNEQLKNQLNETQILLASQQEQLQDLKLVMQQLSSDRDENETNPTAPSTPAISSHDKTARYLDSALLSPMAAGPEEIPPNHPLHFSHLVRPVMRTDLPLYDDFKSLLKICNTTAPSSRAGSGNYSNLALNMKAFTSTPHLATTSSTEKIAQPPSQQQSQSTRSSPTATPLKDTKFYKRTAVEDIEPTLRLDIAPGLSWLVRRSVLACIASSTLIIEPFNAPSRFHGPIYPCALCGENRRKDTYARRYRFRTSDAEDAQRYPLCDYCLGRVRACCDYTGFLRMVRDGLWRAESDDEAKAAWDECVRLRERMFWTRLGGGVAPALGMGVKDVSPRSAVFRKSSDGNGGMDICNNTASSSEDDAEESYGDAKTIVDLSAPEVDDKVAEEGSVRTVRIDSAHGDGDGKDGNAAGKSEEVASEKKNESLSPTNQGDAVNVSHIGRDRLVGAGKEQSVSVTAESVRETDALSTPDYGKAGDAGGSSTGVQTVTEKADIIADGHESPGTHDVHNDIAPTANSSTPKATVENNNSSNSHEEASAHAPELSEREAIAAGSHDDNEEKTLNDETAGKRESEDIDNKDSDTAVSDSSDAKLAITIPGAF